MIESEEFYANHYLNWLAGEVKKEAAQFFFAVKLREGAVNPAALESAKSLKFLGERAYEFLDKRVETEAA